MNVVGHFLLFWPIIELLKWIPLVGGLLGFAFSIAACCCACIYGTTLHLLLMGVAWIVYRPLYGLLLLTGVAALVVTMFIYPNNSDDKTKDGSSTKDKSE